MFPFHQVLRQRSASLAEVQRSAQSAQTERAAVEERLRGLQRAVAMLETEKKDAERQAVRMEKDKNALRNTLDKVSAVSRAQQMCNFFHSIILRFCLNWCYYEQLFFSQTINKGNVQQAGFVHKT